MIGQDLDAPPQWSRLLERRPAAFLDVDGTLVEFERYPDLVRATGDLVVLLQQIERILDGGLALLSGRPLSDLDRVFAPWLPYAAGVHGVEVRGPSGIRRHSPEPQLLDQLGQRARAVADQIPGVWVEDKTVGVALHYREAPKAADEVAAAAQRLAQEVPGFEVQPGVFVLELRPSGWDKGRALIELMAGPPFSGRLPVVVGDDRTDEDAFLAARELGGVSVIVGDRSPTEASYRLQDPQAVRQWLSQILEVSQR